MEMKEIHAVELVRSIRDEIYEETKHLTPEEFKAFITREANRSPPAAKKTIARPKPPSKCG